MKLDEHHVRFGPRVLLLVVVAAVFAISFVLLGRVIGPQSHWLVLLSMFYFLGLAKLAAPLVRLRMPKDLFPIRGWERDRRLLRRLGVIGFGKLLRLAPLRYLNSGVYLDRRHPDAAAVRALVESGEATHFWAAALFTPCIVVTAVRGRWDVVAGFALAQVLVNVYPILHLRHVRDRFDRAIRRSDEARR